MLVWQCSSGGSSQPAAPKEKYLYSNMQIQNEKHLSVVNIPVETPLAELEKQLNAQLNGLLYEDNSFEDDNSDNLKAKVWKISPIKVQAIDSTFLFEVPLKVWVSVGYKVSPLGLTLSGHKETEFAVRIRFISKMHISPSWKVISETSVDSYDWITEPVIKVAGFTLPVKSMVSRTLNRNFEKITKAIDEQVGSTIDLKTHVQKAWDLARRPVELSKAYNTWLMVVPTGVVMTPLVVRNNVIRSTIGLRGYTQTVTSMIPPEPVTNAGLPNLEIVNKIPGAYRVGLISMVSYKEATRLAKAEFVGKTFSYSNGKYTVEVTDLDLFGQNEFLIIKAVLRGSMNGTIYLRGMPHYDAATKNLTLKNLDYDLDTRNVIIKTAGWLLQGKFSAMMERNFVFPIGKQITEAQRSIQKMLTQNNLAKGIMLTGTLEEIVPDRVYLTPENIYSVVFARGQVSLRLEGLL
ncbi:DUF4403 family protein [Cytophagaceae bacterium SJW1-29]|uniref:DUF4403 family protein n=2 Tax=Salmonirosea aquatica TaxID=2654236 RepID=A0A7C9BEI7_9BACT|nr:DUF4403 family protein [Cytophagaceae bacterium SJW1-29]